MLQLNKDYVKVVEGVSWENESGRHVSYELKSSLDNFNLNGSASSSFWKVTRDPKTQILLIGINNIYGKNVEQHLPRYRLGFKGLVIPQEKFGQLRGLELGLTPVNKTKFRATPVEEGESFLVNTKNSKYDSARTDYVISPKHKQLNDVLEALGAPKDLLVRE
ncbi:MAG: hypothetical protein KC550_00220 [Nanoarchaeota archaeon]|nr:hypothetical protein [Nanoarchaeota archaeon]